MSPLKDRTGRTFGAWIGAAAVSVVVLLGANHGVESGRTEAPPKKTCPVETVHVPDGPDGMGGCWPGPLTTGVPDGVTLTDYTGPNTITTDNTVIDGVDTDGGEITIGATNVTIRNSKVGVVTIPEECADCSVTVEDSEIDGGTWTGAAIGFHNYTVRRSEVKNAWINVHCEGDCVVEDSYAHAPIAPDGISTHNNAFLTNGGSNMTVTHNTLWCSVEINNVGGGCTANLALQSDFANVTNVDIDRNLFPVSPSSSYCMTGGDQPAKPFHDPENISITNNVFGKRTSNPGIGRCGVFGTVTDFKVGGPGHVFTSNTFTDGTTVSPNS
jgi:hypothetical protein